MKFWEFNKIKHGNEFSNACFYCKLHYDKNPDCNEKTLEGCIYLDAMELVNAQSSLNGINLLDWDCLQKLEFGGENE